MSTEPSKALLRKVTKKRFLAFAHGQLNWDDFENIRRSLGEQTANKIRQDDYAGLKFGDAPLMEYFESRGAVIKPKGRVVWFDPLR